MNVCFKEPCQMLPRENTETRSSPHKLSSGPGTVRLTYAVPVDVMLAVLSHYSWYRHLLEQPR